MVSATGGFGLGKNTPTQNPDGSISIGGIASGLDSTAIINALLQVEQLPITNLQSKQAAIQQKQGTINSINSGISSLLSAVSALTDLSVVAAKSAVTNEYTTGTPNLAVSAASTAAVGSFAVNIQSVATNTKVVSTGALGQAVTQNVKLADAGFAVPVTSGTFSINGTTITIDDNTVLSDGVDAPGANTIVSKINNAGVGVTATVVNDADGRLNLIQLNSGATIQLGSGGDTSNFLSASNLLQSPGTTTRTSTRSMAGVNQSATLTSARLLTPVAAGSGSFKINGVSIAYDSGVDSMSDVISRINASAAGVTASFDVSSDRMTMTSNQTGSSTISLQDVSGNFLAATGVLAATPTLGANASYQINGGTTQYSASNTVTDAVNGVTLIFSGTTTSPITVSVSPNNSTLQSNIQNFVTSYNSVMGQIKSATAYADPSKGGDSSQNGPLFGDSMTIGIQQTLRSMITNRAAGITGDLNSLVALGLNFGAVGSAVGSTDTLQFDTAKFTKAMTTNPDGVRDLLASFTADATLDPTSFGSIASISGRPTAVPDSGKYVITSTAAGVLTVTFTPDNGSGDVTSAGTLTAGGTNTTMIPGLTITAKNPLVDGQDTITITAAQEGIGKSLADYLGALTAPGGMFAASNDSSQAQIADINTQITAMGTRMDARRTQLTQEFSNLEVMMSQLQSQQQTLTQLTNQLTANSTKK